MNSMQTENWLCMLQIYDATGCHLADSVRLTQRKERLATTTHPFPSFTSFEVCVSPFVNIYRNSSSRHMWINIQSDEDAAIGRIFALLWPNPFIRDDEESVAFKIVHQEMN